MSSKEKTKIYKPVCITTIILATIILLTSILSNQSMSIKIASVRELQRYAEATEIQGRVIVRCLDTQGKILKEDEILTGKAGTEYNVTRPEVSAYGAYGLDPINKVGNFDENDTLVKFVYAKKSDNVNINNEDNVITVQILNEQQQELPEIKMNIINKNEEGTVITGSKFSIKDADGNVIRNATSYAEKFIIGSLQLASEGTDKFSITQTSAPEGYETLIDEIELLVVKTLNQETGKYEVSVDITKVSGVQADIIDGEIVVTITNTAEEIEEPDEPTVPDVPDQPDEPVVPEEPEEPIIPEQPVKIFDLKIEKDVKEVKVSNSKETNTYTKKNANDIIKIDIAKSKISETKIEVTYILKVTNVGEVEGFVTELTDMIPAGMTIISDENWTADGNTAKTTVLKDSLLQPGESKTVEIKLQWNTAESNIGIKNNMAKISSYSNVDNIEDKDETNNIDNDNILITVKTGETVNYAIQVVMIITIIACVALLIKKK